MVNYQKMAVKLATVIAIALISFVWILPVQAIEQNFELKSDRGYRLETSLAYRQTQNNKISAQGKGKTEVIDFLQVRFYNPDGKMIASYDNIVGGTVQSEYFEFNYDPNTQELIGNVDLGGESAGDVFLKGNMQEGLSLIEVESTGVEKVVNSGKWTTAKTN
ncbi:MAG: hypothetical protein AAFO95_07185 [Cyanobacteria bacterium J06600_6]